MAERPFVWDATGLLYAIACGRLDWLLEAAGRGRHHVVPLKVAEELARKGMSFPDGQMEVRDLEDLDDILLLAHWQKLMGVRDEHNAGEAWVAALAQSLGGVAVVDDQKARKVIRRNKADLAVHGALWAISRGVVEGRAPGPQAYSGLCDQMLIASKNGVGGLRWPFVPGGYPGWYDEHRDELMRP